MSIVELAAFSWLQPSTAQVYLASCQNTRKAKAASVCIAKPPFVCDLLAIIVREGSR